MLRPDSRLCMLALLLIALVTVSLAATNTPFFTDEFSETRWNCQNMAPDATNWWVNGTMTVVNQSGCQGGYQVIVGVSAVATDSGSMIFKGNVPTGADQEIRGKVKIAPSATSGRFSLYLDATNDARFNSPLSATGSGYVVRFVINSGLSDSTQKSGSLAIHRFGAGYPSIVQLAETTASLKLDSTIRATRSYSNGTWRILVHVDDKFLLSVADSSLTSGKPGLGFTDASSASDAYWDRVEIATIEHGAPDMTSLPTVIQFSAAPGYVAMQWPPMPDTSGGSSYGASGISRYNVYRNGTLRGTLILDPQQGDPPNFYYDSGVTANTLYTYKIRAYDRHSNYAEASVNVTTPSGTGTAVSMLPRRVGQPVNASSWGSGGENIDLLSGNLNYIHPVLTAVGRNGYSAPLMLSYNAQNFVKENGVEFPVRHSVGYGFGWKMQFGAIRRVPETGPTVSYYVFEDATGAEYPLDVLSGVSTWKPSGFSPILDFNAAGNVVHFKDGSFWYMECVSAANEFDKGTRYPTVLQHPNGNRIYVRYYAGSGASWPNSSARIHEIEDVRAQGSNPRWTYRFTYSGSPSGHLATIANNIGSGEQYTFSYSPSPLPLYSPYSPQLPYATDTFLNAIATEGGENVTSFTYSSNNSGELTRVTFPYGGTIDYTYTSANYSGKETRQVATRVLTPTPGDTPQPYTFERTSAATIPATTRVLDAANTSDKLWTFDTNPASISYGLWTQLDERELPSFSVKRRQTPAYDYQLPAKVFIKQVDTTLDPGTANALTTRSSQWLDEYGNLTSSTTHDFGPSFAALRTVQLTYSYPTTGQHRDMYFFNRVTKVEVTQGGVTQTMQQTTYGDGSSLETGISCPAGAENFEGVYYCTSGAVRANVQAVTSGGVTTEFRYDYQGNMVRSWGASPQVTATYSGGTNYVLPEVITPNSTSQLATSFTFDGAMRPTQSTAPNNAVARTWYDSAGRVNKTQSPVGSYTHYYFDYANRKNEVAVSASSSSTDLSNRTFSRTWFDGLGRPIKTESGGANTVLSVTETEYAPCACSPTGKMKRVSLPYAPGGTVRWTTYTYDALGRTLSVTLPGDGLVPSAGATTYEYLKNTVKITDAATNWKKYETNALGELVKVIEPNPAEGADLETTYTYNIRGQLTTATMTRAGKTQVRTFVYSDTTGRLESVTKPETGTTAYTYNTDGTVLHTIDAKNQKTEFTYDSLKRVTAIKRFVNSGGVFVEQPCQQLNYTYDSGTGANLWGRVAKITSKSCEPYYLDEYSETFSYLSSGLLDYRDSRWVRTINPATTRTLRVQPTWNSYGQMTGYAYGTIGSLYSYTMSYDNAWRPAGLTGEGLNLVSAVNYNAAGAITGFERRESVTSVVTNTYGYNFLYQMTMQKVVQGTNTTLQELNYTFSADKNNGQITSQKDELSGETVVYQYDKLNRLISAETTGAGGWGLSWTYDGFGNREQQTNLKGSVPVHSVSVDKLNNRIDSPGYQYDANGNMTQMPLMTMGYDVANRMVSSDHSSQGATTYRYNHANQRIYMKTGTKISYFLYGLSGERLLEMEEQCGGNCWNYQETQRWIYFAGRKMFSKTGTTLKAVTPNRLASEAKHFPYGETDGTPPADTKDYFATYRRDGTGLDYAWNRYYSPTMGRFTTADPYGGSASLSDPQTWNRYAYVANNPISRMDRNGLWMTSIHSENGDGYYICGISLWENPFSGWANICGYGPFSEEMFYLYQNGGGATSSTPRSTWSPRELALYWRSKAAEVGDCAAVAGFATDIANGVIDRGGTVKDFMDSFGVLTNADPSLPSGVKAASGRDFVSIPVAPSGSTFQTEFQNGFGSSTGARPDQAQSWHFSLFLQVGALYGGLASRANQGDIDALFSLNYALATAAVGVELAQDPLKALLDPNWGDVNLGTAAGRLGADIAGGVVPLSSVGAAIQDRMCKR